VPDLYTKFSMCVCIAHSCRSDNNENGRTDEPVTPHQTTLLKIVDSFLQSKERRHSTDRYEIHSRLGPLFANTFFSLSAYAQGAIDRSLRSSSTGLTFTCYNYAGSLNSGTIPKELDVRLPKACEALVLLTQCMVTVSLAAESKSSELSGQTNVKIFFNEQRRGKQGIVESLVGM
jgi:ataxin-10